MWVVVGGAETSMPRMMPLIPHHVQKQRRLQQLQQERGLRVDADAFDNQFRRRDEAQQVGALYHGYGTHYADVWVGTPPQRQTVIVDTGSSLTAFPCTGCNDCGAPSYHIDNYFDFQVSSTFHKTPCGECQRGSCVAAGSSNEQCKISMSYQEGSSWYAFEAKDVSYVGGPHTVALVDDNGSEDIDPRYARHFQFPITFGCQYRLTGLFKTQLADGIMGMENAKTSLWKQMYSAGKMGEEQKFSLCFSRPRQAARQGTEAGAMTFGGADTRLHKTDMVFSSQAGSKSGFFTVRIRSMYLRHGSGGESAKSTDPAAKIINLKIPEADLNQGGVIVDSGTTDTYFNRKISTSFRNAFKQLSGTAFSHNGLDLTTDDLSGYPTILFQLYGDETENQAISGSDPNQVAGLVGDIDPDHPYDVMIAIPPSHYMEQDSTGKYTARFYDTESGGSVLGANAMMGHDIMFDVDNLRIGWAESDCDYNKLITEGGYSDVLDGAAYEADTADNAKNADNANNAEGNDDGPEVTNDDDDSNAENDPDGAADDDNVDDDEDGKTSNEEHKPDTQKKDHPSHESSHHDDQSPVDDLKKAMNGLADACDTTSCRVGVTMTIFFAIAVGCCCGRWLCGPKHAYARYDLAELELSDASFRDKGSYSDDAEFGEFATERRIT